MTDAEAQAQANEALARRVKVELRKRMRSVRGTTPLSAIAERSARIVDRLSAHEPFAKAMSVALFWPIVERHEVDLRALDPALRARGVAVAYPSIDPDTRAMTFRFALPEHLAERGMLFEEPPPEAPEADALDLIVVPALAVDARGHRIGYGAGFYDRTLPRFAPPARTVVVAFDWQLVVEVPVTEGDVPVDAIVTDARVLDAER